MRGWPLTVRGTGAVLLGLLCFFLAHGLALPDLLYVGVLLIVMVAVSVGILHLRRRAEKADRVFDPDLPAAGTDVGVHVRVGTASSLPSPTATWHDALPPGFDGEASGVFPAVRAGLGAGAVTIDYRMRAARRGVHRIGPLRITAIDPFGLARRTRSIGAATTLTVTPAVVELDPLTERPGDAAGTSQSTSDQLGQGSDNLVPRPYLPGDSRRRIHWRASAHRDRLMVRQEEQETTPEATVALDLRAAAWDPAAARPGADPLFEEAVTACVSVVARLVGEGYRVHVVDAAGHDLTEALDADDTVAMDRFVIGLATLTPTGGSDWSGVVGRFSGTLTGPLVVIAGALAVPDTTALATVGHHSTFPVLLWVRAPGVADLSASGWRCAQIGPRCELTESWRTATEGSGAHVH